MKLKRLLVILSILVIVTPMAKAVATYAYGNISDTTIILGMAYNSGKVRSDYRAKWDSTSVYVKPKYFNGTLQYVNMRTLGAYNTSGGGECDKSLRNYYFSSVGTAYFMKNMINEDGYWYAALQGWSGFGEGSVTIEWSPDSIGSYPEMPY